MPDLIAQGDGRWRRGLPEIAAGRDVLLGRLPQTSPPPPKRSLDEGTRGEHAGGELGRSSVYADAGVSRVAAVDQPQKRHVAAIPWAVPWDSSISRHHAILRVIQGDRLQVTRDPRARNPIFYRGKPRDQFVVVPGEHFVIGQTTFTLARRPGFTDPVESLLESAGNAGSSLRPGTPVVRTSANPSPDELTADLTDLQSLQGDMAPSPATDVTEMAFAESALRQRSFHDTQARIELLARLPDLVAGSVSDEELFARVTDVLLRATPSASAVAIVRATIGDAANKSEASGASGYAMQILHYDVRNQESTSHDVSTKLVMATVRRRDSVLHLWDKHLHRGPEASLVGDAAASSPLDYTATENVDWAFCVPLRSDACRGWVLYVTGTRSRVVEMNNRAGGSSTLVDRLSDDVKFAEVVGSLVSGIRQANHFQQRHAAMRRFFAPVVLDAIAGTDSESWLQPRECDLSVMFCDLRGFSRTSEIQSGQLLVLLEQVSAALGVMTKHILDTEGVIGDFHGDAAMGFWGWPLPLPHGTDPMVAASAAAARAAAAIRQDYARGQSDFRCGIGIASGKAVAGRIGTVDQVKVTAFGPVVNLASRLEGLTKIFGVEILVDQVTAKHLQASAGFRLRTLGRVRAAGTKTPIEIYQLLVPVENAPQLSESQLQLSHEAFTAFGEGRWDDAYQQLHDLPAWDRPKDVLLQRILLHHRTAPADWDGVLEFPK
jgi:adenylate cyclase